MKKFILLGMLVISLCVAMACKNPAPSNPGPFVVRFMGNGADSPPPDLTNVPKGSKITNPGAASWGGHFFNGWTTAQGGGKQWDFDTDTVLQDTNLWAQWIDAPVYHTVSVDANNGTEVDEISVLRWDGLPNPGVPTPPDVDQVFLGWYQDTACRQPCTFSSTYIAKDMAIYGKWAPKGEPYPSGEGGIQSGIWLTVRRVGETNTINGEIESSNPEFPLPTALRFLLFWGNSTPGPSAENEYNWDAEWVKRSMIGFVNVSDAGGGIYTFSANLGEDGSNLDTWCFLAELDMNGYTPCVSNRAYLH